MYLYHSLRTALGFTSMYSSGSDVFGCGDNPPHTFKGPCIGATGDGDGAMIGGGAPRYKSHLGDPGSYRGGFRRLIAL